ncbi:cGMP-dependent 3',5'-cyclic phosphodiesterase-like [Sinocyclocheilus grahami]|uniref:cGMP-dependent 3',5'-cyclic phosphodiesterase-like n=1 Tax=Sinocyclocheilus grahami TaxID=75366 RepID=UPI0007ACD2CF|nr:PREDICTED: cGMP-dependent 3',5'-cyclic phosphodiesterase-like [Sinocyclocheilus grahami]
MQRHAQLRDTHRDAVQDALLQLASIVDVNSLQTTIKDVLRVVLPDMECVFVYLLEAESRLRCEDPPHEVQSEGKLRDAVKQQKRLQCSGLPSAELHQNQTGSLTAPLPAHKRALIIPLVDRDEGKVIALILLCCKPLTEKDEQNLNILEKHLTVACKRVRDIQRCSKRPHAQSHNAPAKPKPHTDYRELDRKILRLCGELYDLDAASLQLKVINYLQTETQSQCCCLLLVSEDNHQLFCQVVGDKVLEEEISFPLMFGRFGQVVETKKPITLQDVSQEERGLLSSLLGFEPNSMLCVPVISQATGQVVALACTFNKLSGQRYMEADEHVIQHCFCYTSTVLTSTLAFQKEQKLKFECQVRGGEELFLLLILRRRLQNCYCDIPSVADPVLSLSVSEQKEFRIPADQGIAGHVATTGKILNIKDAYSHPLFYRGVDDSTGFRTRNILCFPIKDENEEVIGVAELVNKTNGPWFNRFDEDLATAFSIYCGISIAHVRVSAASLDHSTQYHNGVRHVQSICSCCCRFCLMVKKGYRDPPYHNWMHAFSVSHFCYLLYKNLQLSNYLEDIEILALFVSCMCHDLDHRGTNNSFQVDSQSVLAALYSSEGSVMERHHFAQAIAILNTHGCNIFEKFSRKDYQRMLDLMRDIILATDLAHHLRIFRDLQKMADAGYNPRSQAHRSLLLCLLMTSCDLSDQTKGWKTTRKIAELIYKEFFSQGDLEKAMGNRPSEMMDREKAYIPELQISFMEHIAMPIYKLLQEIFPRSAELYERVAANREQWAKVSHKFTIRGLPSNNSLDFLDEEFELLQSQGAFGDDSHRMNGCLDDDCDKHNQ